EMWDGRKHISTQFAKVNVYSDSIPSDGRFTMGIDTTRRVTFGYPLPFSSSFFGFFHQDHFFANQPGLADSITYITGWLKKQITTDGCMYETVEFKAGDIIAEQRIYPLDKQMITIKQGRADFYRYRNGEYQPQGKINDNLLNTMKPQFYRIEYVLRNQNLKPIGVTDLNVLLDVMIDDRDNAELTALGRTIPMNTKYTGNMVPKNWEGTDSTKKPVLSIVLQGEKLTQPEEIRYGHWQNLRRLRIDTTFKAKDYADDSAVLLKWNPKFVPASESKSYSFIIGSRMEGEIRYLYHSYTEKSKHSAFFTTGESEISATDKAKIKKALQSVKYDCILVEGFADNVGTDKDNYTLSQSRAAAVRNFLIKELGFKPELILVKINGEFFSNQAGKQVKDRRVDVTIYSKTK
ncbi:MAG: OmpA family protein, partial [Bacteroidetes bacterium]|nr:OmpA family protein [Bacteroidota bacterium]